MKISHIIAILVIAVAIAIVISTASDTSSYVSFDQAYQMAQVDNKSSVHVVGELKKDAQGHIIGLEESADHLAFTFLLIDENKKEQKVYYNEPMPADFTKSEKVVVIGKYKSGNFVASKILLKCPSKYQEQKLNASL
ncbi:MAG: cytochrome C biogenesis protein [Azospira oryzae]|jgi:cytochrome c-type biogenesis protein CcmE|nr:MAG: cytochrome C biogenesis protein [Azospira oryzae]